MENKKESEINVVRELIELLDLSGVVFTMDALHCQKADATPRRRQDGAYKSATQVRKGATLEFISSA